MNVLMLFSMCGQTALMPAEPVALRDNLTIPGRTASVLSPSRGRCWLEFAAALATGRLRLKQSDQSEVILKAIEHVKATPSALLGLLILANDA